VDRPTISILLPVFDAERTLPVCLESIGRQTLRDWECIVMDDGSTDGSLAVARRCAAADPRFRVISGVHRGLVDTLNRGLAHCRGALIARMDADDWMHRERLAAQRDALEADPALAAVGCHVRLFPRASVGPGMRRYERWLLSIDSARRVREECFVECPVPHPTLVLRRAVLETLRYRQCSWPEDYDLVLRLLLSGGEIGVVPRRLLAWRQSEGRLSRRSPNYTIERFVACKAAFLAESFLAGVDRYVLWGYGETGKALGRALRSHGKHPAAIVELHPGRIGSRIHGAPVIHVEELQRPAPAPVVVSVAGAQARAEIRAELHRKGFREIEDYVCAA